jgi:two-component system LytT family sensor kinase
MVYLSIRLVTDVMARNHWWERSWRLNCIEVGTAILGTYPVVWVMDYLRHRNQRRDTSPLTTRRLFREFGEVYLYTMLIVNAVITPMVALTDDGLQWYDFVDINVLPPLFNLMYYAMTRAISSLRRSYEQQIQIEKFSNDRLQTELRFLRAQFHPHFLFNALNTVYFQREEDTAQARKTVEKLSELLRYQLYDPQQQVPVSRELGYLSSFIDLQRQRMNEHLDLDVRFDPRLSGQLLYPLLLLPLVENAFKYAGGEYWIRIHAGLEGEALRFEVSNAVPPGASNGSPRHAGGIGLENLRRRLELLYPGQHEFSAERQNNHFTAILVIPVCEPSPVSSPTTSR